MPFEIHAPGNFVCGEGDRIKAQKKKICEASLQFLNILQCGNIKIIEAELKVNQCSLGIIQSLTELPVSLVILELGYPYSPMESVEMMFYLFWLL